MARNIPRGPHLNFWSGHAEENFMSIRLSVLMLATLSLVSRAQTALPPDIHPVTLSRLPPVTAEDLDEEGRRLLAARTNFTPGPGPTHITIYSPRERDLGIPSGEKSPVGPRYFQLAVLITAREIDQQYEWSAHEPAGLRQGLEQSVIDVVRYDRAVTGLSDKDATMISFGRALFREHQVSSELWQKMVMHFGRQQTVQIMTIMGEYFRVGFMLNAVDQRLPAGRKALLPPLKR
jgi:4-carboxymuconolactone decarboxylase